MITVTKAGRASEMSSKSTSLIELSMSTPTKTRAPVVAADGMSRKRGAKNRAMAKSSPVEKEVIPVRPPSAMPALLSTKVVTVEVPSTAPTEVPMASAMSACFMFFTLPSASIISVLAAAPMSVPMVLKMSMNTSAKMVSAMSGVRSDLKSNCKNVGAMDLGIDKGAKPSGITVTPRGMPMSVQAAML